MMAWSNAAKRVAAAVLAGGLIAAAALAIEPEPRVQPLFPAVEASADVAAAERSIWYCPWVEAGAERDTVIAVASVGAADATLSLPSPSPTEPVDEFEVVLGELSAAALEVGDLVRRGQSPGFVEFSGGPAMAATLMRSPTLLTGDRCVASAPKVWHLTGGTTRTGTNLTLRLFNPFPENARVLLTASSEFGNEPLPRGSLDVPARAWRDVDLSQDVPFLDELSLTVFSETGLVLPSFVLSNGTDEATWPGTGLSDTWYFPVAALEGIESEVVFTNPGDAPLAVDIDVYTSSGPVPGTALTLEPGAPQRLALTEIGEGALAVRVRASGRIAAVVVAEEVIVPEDLGGGEGEAPPEDEAVPGGKLAATVGSDTPATKWLIAGTGATSNVNPTIWLLNPNEGSVTVTLQPLGERAGATEKISLEGESVVRYPIRDTADLGYLIDATEPIAVAWSAASPLGLAFVAGVAVGG